jgi:hypothetical protein
VSDDSLVAALARAQAKMPPVHKTKVNKHFTSTYADLADVLAAVRPTLAAEGIAIVQPIRITEHGAELVTALLKGDERIESALPLPLDSKPQDMGSRLTYLRRFQLAALVGVAAEDDDDGNAAQASTSVPKRKPMQAKVTEHTAPANTDRPMPDGEALSFDQLVQIKDWFDGLPDDVRKARKRAFVQQLGDPQSLRADQWADVERFMSAEAF